MSVVLLWVLSELALEDGKFHRHLIFETAKQEASLKTVDVYSSKEDCRTALMEYSRSDRDLYISEGIGQLTMQYKTSNYDVYLFCTFMRMDIADLNKLK